jgi:hypothetical protein
MSHGPEEDATRKPNPSRARPLAAAALLGVTLALAGCGDSSSRPGVARLPSAEGAASGAGASPAGRRGDGATPESTTSHQQKEVDYARCLRAHGAGEVPEPGDGRSIVNGFGDGGPNPGPPQVKAAQKQCNGLLPSGGAPGPQVREQAVERALRFAKCMRSHGQPSFPDPGGGAGGHVRIGGPGSGIDLGSPRFKAAGKACRRYFGPAGTTPLPPQGN